MDDIQICGLPETLILGVSSRRNPQASWFVTNGLPGIPLDQLEASVQAAFNLWSQVANCQGSKAPSQSQADLIITPARLDGPMGVLADCELPGPSVQRMRLDNGERWTIHIGSNVPQGLIDLQRVLAHELGHFWGIGHIQNGNLMAPTYSTRIESPKSGDIQEIQGRYGPPVVNNPTHPDEPDRMVIYGKSGRITAEFKLTRVS